jgi:hypothetical protein
MKNSKILLFAPDESKNHTFDSQVQLYAFFGYTNTIQILFLVVYLPVAMCGFCLNTISYRLFIKCKKDCGASLLFVYLKLTTFVSLILNFLEILFGLLFYSKLKMSNSYFTQALICYFLKPVHNLLIFVKTLLDLLIVIDRVATFRPEYKIFFKPKPWINFCLILLLCSLLSIPNFFLYTPEEHRELTYYDDKLVKVDDFYIINTSNFAKTRLGKIVFLAQIIMRNILPTLLEILYNLLSCFHLRKYLVKKHVLMNLAKKPKTERTSLKSETHAHNESRSSSNSLYQNMNVENNLTRMVIAVTLVSIVHQVFYASFSIYNLDHRVSIGFTFYYSFIHVLRYSSNFFLFYFFNKKFKGVFKQKFVVRFL